MPEAGLRFVGGPEAQVEELPWGPYEWLCRPGLTDAEKLLLVRVTIPPGKGHAFHRHPEMEEIIYVVSGQATQWVEHDHETLGPGDTAHIPVDLVHGTYNNGDQPLVFLAIFSPAKVEGPLLIDMSCEKPWCDLTPLN